MTFVIIGGGPTGAELAGSLAEIAHHTLSRDFRSIDPTHSRVLLVEGGPRILPSFPPDLSEHAERLLKKIGVEVRTGSIVTGVDKDGVLLGEERIKAGTVLWAAGVTASPLLKSLGVPLDRAGRVSVQPDLSVADHPEVFVVGDAAAILPAGAERPLPGVAQVAMQSGKVAAANILRLVGGGATQPFAYNDRGNMATLGRAAAVAQIGTWHSSGIVAWWLWLTIHLAYIIGFRNRAQVMLQWTWSYFTWERGARLITKVGNE
jgi:NADH dehydrogenase